MCHCITKQCGVIPFRLIPFCLTKSANVPCTESATTAVKFYTFSLFSVYGGVVGVKFPSAALCM